MFKYHNQVLITLLFLADLFLAGAVWELAYWARFYWIDWPSAPMIPPHYHYWKALWVVMGLSGAVFAFSGVYRSQRVSEPWQEILHLIQACFVLFVLLVALAFFYRRFSYSRTHVVYFILILALCLILARWGLYLILHALHRRGRHIRNLLIVGTGEVVAGFAQALGRYKSTGVWLKGIVTLEAEPLPAQLREIPILGHLEELPELLKRHEIDQVFLALSGAQQAALPRLRELLYDQLVDVKIIPDLGTFRRLRTDVDIFEGIPIVTVTQSPMTGWNMVMKRALDISGTLAALVIFGPVMALIALLVKLTSPGPVFYRQERMGLDGETFQTLKFRSMRVDAESQTGAIWAKADDDRRTAFGSFLRRTSLDELPQLFNVLKGEMSLVGPRPERPVFIKDFKKQIPNYMLRHKVKAGITGWAQINGWRGNTSLEKRIEFDLYYIEHWSLWFDIKILFLTIFKGFVDPNAY